MEVFFSILFGTFISEELALASSLVLVARHQITWEMAFGICFLGICLGNFGLYFLGVAASKFKFEHRFPFLKKDLSHALTAAIIISRFVPGTRFPTYVAAGFLRYSLLHFTILTLISVFAWVFLVLTGGPALFHFLDGHWLILAAIFIFFLLAARFLFAWLTHPKKII